MCHKTIKNGFFIKYQVANNGNVAGIAKRPGGEWVCDIYLITEKLSF